MPEFTKAASGETFDARLDTIIAGLTRGEYVDDTLISNTVFNLRFLLNWLIKPLSCLIKTDPVASFRATKVAESYEKYCRANEDYLKENNGARIQKAVSFIDLLAGKVRDENKPALATAIASISSIVQPADVPTPNVDPEPAETSVHDEAAKPTDPIAAQMELVVLTPTTPVTLVSPAVVATAEKAETKATELIHTEADTPETASVAASNLPPTCPAALSLKAGTTSLAVQQSTANFAYDLHAQIVKGAKGSDCFSPVGLVDMLGLVMKGSDNEASIATRKRLSLDRIELQVLEQDLKLRRNDLGAQQVTVATAYIVKDGVKKTEQAVEMTEHVKKYGAVTIQPTKDDSARKHVNKWVSSLATVEKDLLSGAYTHATDTRIACAIMNVVSLKPSIQQVPTEKLERAFTFANNKKIDIDFFGFVDIKVLEIDKFKMFILPYKTTDEQSPLFKAIFLPNDKETDLTQLRAALEPRFLKKCLAEYRQSNENATVYMPKMNVAHQQFTLLEHVKSAELPVGKLAGEEVTSLMQFVRFREEVAEVTPATMAQPKPLFVDHPFCYFVMSGDDVVLEGRVTDSKALELNAKASRWG